MFRLYIMSNKEFDPYNIELFGNDFLDEMRTSESYNKQESPKIEGQQIKSANTSRKRKSSSRTLDEIFDDEDFKEFIKNNIKPIDSPRQSNVDNDDEFLKQMDELYEILESLEDKEKTHKSIDNETRQSIEYLVYAFCVSSLKCGKKKYLDDAHIFSGRDYTEILDNVNIIKEKYSKNLDILNKELLFITYKYKKEKDPIEIIIKELKKTIKRFEKKKKGGKKSYKKKSTKKSRTKKARK